MAIDKPMGYPPNAFKRKWLEAAYREKVEYFDSEKFEDFLRDSKNLNYEEAQEEIRKMPAEKEVSESELIKKGQQYSAQSEVEHYRVIADQARQEGQEFYASAMEDMIAKIIASESKAKAQRKTPEKKKPEQKPLVAAQEKPQPATTDYIKDLCKQSPLTHDEIQHLAQEVKLSDIDTAINIVRGCKTLDEFDKYEIEELLNDKARGILERKEPEKIHKPQPAKIKPKISTGKDIFEKEEGMPERPMPRNIPELALSLKPQYSKIIVMGLRNFQEEPSTSKYMPKLDSARLSRLAGEIQRYYLDMETSRIVDWLAVELMAKLGYIILAGGYDWAINRNENTLDSIIIEARTSNSNLPDDAKIKRDVRAALIALNP